MTMKIMRCFGNKIIVAPFLLLLFINSQAIAQDFWQRTNGPEGGLTRAFAINSNGDIFTGTAGGGVYRSTDNGGTWTAVNNGLTNTDLPALAINSNGDIFAGIAGAGVFRSTDNGSSLGVFSLAIDSSGNIFARNLWGRRLPLNR